MTIDQRLREIERRLNALEGHRETADEVDVIVCDFDDRWRVAADFSGIIFDGRNFGRFRGHQAKVLRILWSYFTAATSLYLPIKMIEGRIGCELRDVFTRRGSRRRWEHPAWGSIIQLDGAGGVRLYAPEKNLNVPTFVTSFVPTVSH